MRKGLIFLCCACCILLFTIINLGIAPLENKKVVSTTIQTDENTSEEIKWATANCAKYKDLKDDEDDEDKKKLIQSEIDACERIKTMHDMEYTSFIFDIVIGFVCGLLGLFHLFDIRTNFISITGLIGLGCGVVGFVLSFVYVIYNGLVFTNKYSGVIGRESEGYFAERNGISGTTEYRCIDSDDKDNIFSAYAKFSDLNQKQYNYQNDFYGDDVESYCICQRLFFLCSGSATFDLNDHSTYGCASNILTNDCKYIYAEEIKENNNQDIFDRFLTTLILSLFVCLANIGLAIFGFLIFRTPKDF